LGQSQDGLCDFFVKEAKNLGVRVMGMARVSTSSGASAIADIGALDRAIGGAILY
jgi:hypothetical protein